ncbi:hypothetical protein G6N74_25630 [Mesorhizobium sp. CGMCC 1.15528]|uniref:Uncharacterized protein n=1 Tax=Mesorhizobium zhangyense TaxID=1776730 RepID=A0A7C9RB40_9HYPH|nr:hypothetical protein [Mesorhizobium zhangyense]NGN44455.1 hypothetical protein [Mesorhizobium zhangyense]
MASDEAIALFERLISDELRQREGLLSMASSGNTKGTEMAIKQSDRQIATYQMLIEMAKDLARANSGDGDAPDTV